MEKIPVDLNLSDNEEIHLDGKLQEIQGTKKGSIHAFCDLGVIVSSIYHDTLDST